MTVLQTALPLVPDWDKIITGAFLVLSNAGTWLLSRKKNQATDGAEIAQAKASTSISEAETTLYQKLREEIDALRSDVSRLRSDLDVERRHSRQLELYVWKLQRLMTDKGIEVPPFLDIDYNNSNGNTTTTSPATVVVVTQNKPGDTSNGTS